MMKSMTNLMWRGGLRLMLVGVGIAALAVAPCAWDQPPYEPDAITTLLNVLADDAS